MSRKSRPTEAEQSPDGRYIRFEERLGTGAYKEVFRAYDTETGKEVAWNTVSLSRLPQNEQKRIRNETKILSELDHRNVINFYHVWESLEKEQICFTTEIVTSGTLKEYINRVRGGIRLKVIKKWCRQILEGLNYLHSHNPPIIHRDLKCDNIFINGSTGEIRIGDFGLSSERSVTHAQSVLGTPEFMAPELYDENYSESVDIYAFGMTVLEMATKEYPYEECTNAAQIWKRVTKGQKPGALERIKDCQVRAFIELCLLHHDMRLSAKDLLQHPFLHFRRCDPSREFRIITVLPRVISDVEQKERDREKQEEKDQKEKYRIDKVKREKGLAGSTDQLYTATTPTAHISPSQAHNGRQVSEHMNPNTIASITNQEMTISLQSIPASSAASSVNPLLPPQLTRVTSSPEFGHSTNPRPTLQTPSNQYLGTLTTPRALHISPSMPVICNLDASQPSTPGSAQTVMTPSNAYHSNAGTPASVNSTMNPPHVSSVDVQVDKVEGVIAYIVVQVYFDNKKKKQIKFGFDLKNDTSDSISAEMVKQLRLPDPQLTQHRIAQAIENKLQPIRSGSVKQTSNSSYPLMHSQSHHNLQAPPLPVADANIAGHHTITVAMLPQYQQQHANHTMPHPVQHQTVAAAAAANLPPYAHTLPAEHRRNASIQGHSAFQPVANTRQYSASDAAEMPRLNNNSGNITPELAAQANAGKMNRHHSLPSVGGQPGSVTVVPSIPTNANASQQQHTPPAHPHTNLRGSTVANPSNPSSAAPSPRAGPPSPGPGTATPEESSDDANPHSANNSARNRRQSIDARTSPSFFQHANVALSEKDKEKDREFVNMFGKHIFEIEIDALRHELSQEKPSKLKEKLKIFPHGKEQLENNSLLQKDEFITAIVEEIQKWKKQRNSVNASPQDAHHLYAPPYGRLPEEKESKPQVHQHHHGAGMRTASQDKNSFSESQMLPTPTSGSNRSSIKADPAIANDIERRMHNDIFTSLNSAALHQSHNFSTATLPAERHNPNVGYMTHNTNMRAGDHGTTTGAGNIYATMPPPSTAPSRKPDQMDAAMKRNITAPAPIYTMKMNGTPATAPVAGSHTLRGAADPFKGLGQLRDPSVALPPLDPKTVIIPAPEQDINSPPLGPTNPAADTLPALNANIGVPVRRKSRQDDGDTFLKDSQLLARQVSDPVPAHTHNGSAGTISSSAVHSAAGAPSHLRSASMTHTYPPANRSGLADFDPLLKELPSPLTPMSSGSGSGSGSSTASIHESRVPAMNGLKSASLSSSNSHSSLNSVQYVGMAVPHAQPGRVSRESSSGETHKTQLGDVD